MTVLVCRRRQYCSAMAKPRTPKASKTTEADVFPWLRAIAEKSSAGLLNTENSTQTYTLSATVGPATVERKGPRAKGTTMPVVYLHQGKAYVSYHLLGLYKNDSLMKEVPAELLRHMQGQACFNFREVQAELGAELGRLTQKSVAALRKMRYIE